MPGRSLGEAVISRWNRLLVRLMHRRMWAYKAVLLWLVQRPYLRFVPFPVPAVNGVQDWREQIHNSVMRGVWPKRWLQRGLEAMNVLAMKDAITLRGRLGDELHRGRRDDLGAADVEAASPGSPTSRSDLGTHRAIAELRGERADHVRQMIGPRGGLPKLKTDLIRLAALCNVEVKPDDTVETLKAKVKPVVDEFKSTGVVRSAAAPKPLAQPSTTESTKPSRSRREGYPARQHRNTAAVMEVYGLEHLMHMDEVAMESEDPSWELMPEVFVQEMSGTAGDL